MPQKIAFFGLVHGPLRDAFGDWEKHLASVAAAVVSRSQYALLVDLVAAGPEERENLVAPGVWLRVLPACGRPLIPTDATSWKLAEYLDGVSLVHIHAAVTGLCESATLLCRLRGLPLCITQNALAFDSLFTDLGLAQLADVVICHSQAVAQRLSGDSRVVVLPAKLAETQVNDLAAGLLQVYSQLIAHRRPDACECSS
jgi:hypothetical protein